MRQNTGLLVFVAVLVAAAIAGGYYFLTLNKTEEGGGNQVQDTTPIVAPQVTILTAASDIPANTLITSGDREALFVEKRIDLSARTPDDVLIEEFSLDVEGKVTKTAIRGGDQIKRSLFRAAGIAEQLPTPQPGRSSSKAMTIFVPDLGDILAVGNTVDVLGSFNAEVPYLRFIGSDEEGRVLLFDEKYLDISTKVLAQDIPVLRVIAPPPGFTTDPNAPVPPPAVVPTTDPAAPVDAPLPTAGPTFFNPGALWIVTLAVTDQEAELIKYALDKPGRISLIVRRATDREIVNTTGASLDLLTRLYGVPMIYPQPNVIVDLVDGVPPPLPPNSPPVVIPIPGLTGAGTPQALPTTTAPTPTP